MVKEQFQQTDTAKISQVTFGMMSASEMRQASHVKVTNVLNYDENRKPVSNGPMDLRLGVNLQKSICETCGKSVAECVGHFGFVDLELPCFHVGFFRLTLDVLQMVCKNCSAMLLSEEKKAEFHNILRRPDMSYLHKKNLRKKIHEACRKNAHCLKCGAFNGMVKKASFNKIIHNKYKKKKGSEVDQELLEQFDVAVQNNKDLKPLVNKFQEVLVPTRVQCILGRVAKEDAPLLLMNTCINNPEDLILTRILVAPPCIRPTVMSDSKASSTEDDITSALSDIVRLNSAIQNLKSSGGSITNIMACWDQLQLEVFRMINGETPGVPSAMQANNQQMKGFIQRLKGKQGRFRGNLSGKRVDFSGRTVISPDPNMQIDQVAVPLHIAKTITYPEKVTPANMELMKQLIRNGAHHHPGADILELGQTGEKRALRYGNREHLANTLRVGDTVVRHMMDGDVVLFNRQPSLHKLSIQAFYAKVMPHRTFRFNECCCNPFNADFDGDEMNLHLPQTEEAKAEALVLMGSKSNIITPRSGEPLIAAIQDFITGAFLITQKDIFFSRARAMQIVSSFLSGRDKIANANLPPPAIMKPSQMWTGKQLFGLIIRPNERCPVKVNLEVQNKSYSKSFNPRLNALYGQKDPMDLCPKDGYVCVQNSELMCGSMDKVVLGSGSKSNIFYVMLCNFGEQFAADALARLSKLTPSFLSNSGFSIGLGDVTPGFGLLKETRNLLDKGSSKCDSFIKDFKNHSLVCQPGCDEETSLEALILKELSSIRDHAGLACQQELPTTNSPLTMAICGSKGSSINISQMVAIVGQQAISGSRVPNGFEDRSLPHFHRKTKEANARGFVKNSFNSGLTPSEFFFHTMAGREGLVDTAVKTADTGYIQRRLVKSLEDLCVKYDTTVRNSTGEVVQFEYGGDSLNPAAMEGDNKPISFHRLWEHVKMMTMNSVRHEQSLMGPQIVGLVEDVLLEEQWGQNMEGFIAFKKDLREHIYHEAHKITEARKPLVNNNGQVLQVVNQVCRVTKSQVLHFLEVCLKKFNRAVIEPGEAVGAITAQSVGEPGTQMTLKTFHFAGVASMNITLGVPRVKEIINASKTIQKPIIYAKLDDENDKDMAERVKSRVDRTTLGEISKSMKETILFDEVFIIIQLDEERIRLLKLEVNLYTIKEAILASKLKVYEEDIQVVEGVGLLLHAIERKGSGNHCVKSLSSFKMATLKKHLRDIVVKGVAGIVHAVIYTEEQNKGVSKTKYMLVAEGNNLLGVMATPGVNGKETKSNNTLEVFKTLGIEAARKTIMNEMQEVMVSHGMTIDIRHTMMLADLMTYKGEVLGVSRFGLAKMKESVLMLASFEKTADHLFDSAYYGQQDKINGVSECIIMGMPMNVGTGIFQVLQRAEKPPRRMRRQPIFDLPSFHVPEFQATV